MSKSKQKNQMPGKKSGSITTGSAKTLIEKAKREVPGFRQHFAKFEEQVAKERWINVYYPSNY